VVTALRLSLETSLVAVVLSLLMGLPLAWVLARLDFSGRSLVRAIAMLPMVLPPVVGGVALLAALGRHGVAGGVLAALGISLPFTTAGAIVAEAFVAMPFLVIAAEAGLRQVDSRMEEAAATLGAGRWTTFRRVTLPLAGPSIAAGSALCWARALGEFGATITFAGNVGGRTQTVPLAVYQTLESSRPEGALVMSLALVVLSVAVLVVLRHRWLGVRT